jgi:uncharacterized protein YdaU (DUF1376 family)
MAKDPAVLFYTSDFLTGTILMTNEQKGKYITLLCLQHQKGLLSEKDMLNICQSYDEDIFNKFIKEGSNYYNKRMKEEHEKRVNFSKSRSENRKKGIENKNIISSSYDNHMENENINNIDNSKIIKVEILNSKKWIEEICMKKRISIDVCNKYLNEFLDDAELKGELNDLSDSKRHFVNWLNIKLKAEPKEVVKQTKSNAPDYESFIKG